MSPRDPFIESKDVDLLEPEVRQRVRNLLRSCHHAGIVVQVACTLRGPGKQGELWCRSRSLVELQNIRDTVGVAAPRLTRFVRDDWACFGPKITEHLPGQSFHQWGMAVDVYVLVGGIAIWQPSSVINVVVEVAKGEGIVAKNHRVPNYLFPWHHLQFSKFETPLHNLHLVGGWSDVERAMAERFDI